MKERENNLKKLYIDVDGVLLGKNNPDNIEVVLAKHAKEFLELCLNKYDCYWLTTHCTEGDASRAVRWVMKYADDSVSKLLTAIKPTSWKTLKTEAIDFSSDFYWIDDEPIATEKEVLRKNNSYDRWIYINTWKKPDDLWRAIMILEELDRKASLLSNIEKG